MTRRQDLPRIARVGDAAETLEGERLIVITAEEYRYLLALQDVVEEQSLDSVVDIAHNRMTEINLDEVPYAE